MAKKTTEKKIPEGRVNIVEFKDALAERYLAYALSTIMSRSLPDVRDGLKPVHRRLLFAMLQLKLDPKSGFKKCARVVGDVIGKYHPHGDVAVYDTMVRLAQSFSVRYPLVEGQGNFGSIDGDNPAAMRYTEARLTDVALALLTDLESNTVDFRPNYDGSEEEPALLPSRFPNLLANGSEGIAVGMATSIPPHNADEICDALIHLIENPEAKISRLVRFIKGPDFPTGGIIMEPVENIVAAYESGRGSFRLRAKWEKEELAHGTYQIVVTEIPYQVQKGRLVERIAEVFKEKKVPLLGDLRDESAEEIRIVLEPKNRSVDPEILMASLFKLTDLEVRFALNMNVLDSKHSPRVMNLREVLQEFLNHRHEVLLRKTNHRLTEIDRRLEILKGLLIAYLNLDQVIKIIRNEDDPKEKMMKKWDLSEIQVEAILNMRLRALRKLEEIEINREHKNLSSEKKELKSILADKKKRWQVIADDIRQVKEQFGKKTKLGKRRTEISGEEAKDIDISPEAFVEKEPITVICSTLGWIRAVKGHLEDFSEIKFKEGDRGRFFIKAQTTDKLLLFASDGKFFTIPCDRIPRGKGDGESLRLMIDLTENRDIVTIFVHNPERKLLLASSSGHGFIVDEKDVVASTRTGKQVMNLGDGTRAVAVKPIAGSHVAVIGENRKLLVYAISEIPEMKRGRGVILQKYQDGSLSDIKTFNLTDGLTWQTDKQTRSEKDLTAWVGKRAAAGRLAPNGFSKSNKFGME